MINMPHSRPVLRAVVLSLLGTVCALPAAVQAQTAAKRYSCAEMTQFTVPATAIGLPTRGATITKATDMPASGAEPRAVGAFCRVTGAIASVDPAAPPILFEVNLPTAWNGKALMFGGGGLNGQILSTGGAIRLQPTNVPIPLGRGYATFGSDSGHAGSAADGAFALNEEALRNYAYDALKKTRDVAGQVIAAHYGKKPDKVYFHGSSNGGKEALGMIQRNPEDLDGALVFWPATTIGAQLIQYMRISRAFMEPGAALSIGKRQTLLKATLDACDARDGVKDGLVSDVRGCAKVFDLTTATVSGKPLRCPSGKDEGEFCLSDVQIRALNTLATPITFETPLASGVTHYPGFYLGGLDLGTKVTDDMASIATSLGFGTAAPAIPANANMPFLHVFADQFTRYFVTRNPGGNLMDVDPEKPGAFRDRLVAVGGLLDMPKTDLSAFQKRGGKILMVHGLADQIVAAKGSEEYFEAVSATMGAETVGSFFKYYEVPGTGHSGIGMAYTPTWDTLAALDGWVSEGKAPVAPVITDIYGSPGRTRPLCEYPAWPKYKGSGSPNAAESFECTR